MRTRLILGSLVLICACKERPEQRNEKQKMLPPSQDPWESHAIVRLPNQAARTALIDCARIVPDDVRRQFFPNATVTNANTRAQPGVTASCDIQGGGSVEAQCNHPDAAASAKVADFKKANPMAKEVDVGQDAALLDSGTSQELQAWDPRSGCAVSVTVPKNVDAVAFGRAILEQLPPRG